MIRQLERQLRKFNSATPIVADRWKLHLYINTRPHLHKNSPLSTARDQPSMRECFQSLLADHYMNECTSNCFLEEAHPRQNLPSVVTYSLGAAGNLGLCSSTDLPALREVGAKHANTNGTRALERERQANTRSSMGRPS